MPRGGTIRSLLVTSLSISAYPIGAESTHGPRIGAESVEQLLERRLKGFVMNGITLDGVMQ
jgi:hypothetical protein